MKTKMVLTIGMFGLALGVPLLAHHSFAAEFDASKAIRLTGALTKIEWTNPHSYFYLDVKDENGVVVNWACEGAAPGALSRRGFKNADIKLGDTLVVDGYRAKDGSHLIDAHRNPMARPASPTPSQSASDTAAASFDQMGGFASSGVRTALR